MPDVVRPKTDFDEVLEGDGVVFWRPLAFDCLDDGHVIREDDHMPSLDVREKVANGLVYTVQFALKGAPLR